MYVEFQFAAPVGTVHERPPIVTVPVQHGPNDEPRIVIMVPPAVVPIGGEIEAMTGGG